MSYTYFSVCICGTDCYVYVIIFIALFACLILIALFVYVALLAMFAYPAFIALFACLPLLAGTGSGTDKSLVVLKLVLIKTSFLNVAMKLLFPLILMI